MNHCFFRFFLNEEFKEKRSLFFWLRKLISTNEMQDNIHVYIVNVKTTNDYQIEKSFTFTGKLEIIHNPAEFVIFKNIFLIFFLISQEELKKQ